MRVMQCQAGIGVKSRAYFTLGFLTNHATHIYKLWSIRQLELRIATQKKLAKRTGCAVGSGEIFGQGPMIRGSQLRMNLPETEFEADLVGRVRLVGQASRLSMTGKMPVPPRPGRARIPRRTGDRQEPEHVPHLLAGHRANRLTIGQ
jgi:hypothetical protein